MRIHKAFCVFGALVFVMASVGFFYWSSLGILGKAHSDIRRNIVEHPEFIPTASDVKLFGAGYGTLIADFYWLSAVQYVGSNAIGAEYKKYLASMIGLVTDLSPKFQYPYEVALLLLPDYNERYEKLSKAEQDAHIQEAVALGEKAMKVWCDAKKIELITKENDLTKVTTDPIYRNPCSNSMIPYYLGYIYYWNLHDPIKSSEYYKIASANTDSISGARTMAALMRGKGGDREKAILMFLSLAERNSTANGDISETNESLSANENILQNKDQCSVFSKELGDVLLKAFTQWATLDANFMKRVEAIRKSIVHSLGEGDVSITKNPINFDDYCSTPLSKAVRELNLYYISQADNRYFQKTGKHAENAKKLQQAGYLDYLPVDFQAQDDKIDVIYTYDTEVGQWDYTPGTY